MKESVKERVKESERENEREGEREIHQVSLHPPRVTPVTPWPPLSPHHRSRLSLSPAIVSTPPPDSVTDGDNSCQGIFRSWGTPGDGLGLEEVGLSSLSYTFKDCVR